MFLLIDNYDSFTYNLVQYFQSLGEDPTVLFNDDPRILDLARSGSLETAVSSPRPSTPPQAGLCLALLKPLPRDVPVPGVCLGHQVLGLFGGAEVKVGPVIMHGMQSDIGHDGAGLFTGLPRPLRVGRYHSLVVEAADDDPKLPFRVTARGPLGEVMALRYRDRPWAGLQFHPESVLTADGMSLLANFPCAILPGVSCGTPPVSETLAETVTLTAVMERLACHQDLDGAMAAFAFGKLMDGGMTPAQTGAFLMALRAKGETALELHHAVAAVLERAVPVPEVPDEAIDVVGTGGDGKSSFNCSTTAALTLAGMGFKVAKHGNRVVSSTCGAADVLEMLGMPLEKEPSRIIERMERTGFGFFFAPHFHPAFRHVGPARKELGIRTLFNILGPMVNPSKNHYLLMGVGTPELVPLVADTLAQSPSMRRAAVVHGAGGYDELTPMGPAVVTLLDHGRQSSLPFDPARWGMAPCSQEDLAVHSKEEALLVLRELLQGRGSQHMKDMVALNVALAIHLVRPELDLDKCVTLAREGVEDGAGRVFIPRD